jgi:hypothetical protein
VGEYQVCIDINLRKFVILGTNLAKDKLYPAYRPRGLRAPAKVVGQLCCSPSKLTAGQKLKRHIRLKLGETMIPGQMRLPCLRCICLDLSEPVKLRQSTHPDPNKTTST